MGGYWLLDCSQKAWNCSDQSTQEASFSLERTGAPPVGRPLFDATFLRTNSPLRRKARHRRSRRDFLQRFRWSPQSGSRNPSVCFFTTAAETKNVDARSVWQKLLCERHRDRSPPPATAFSSFVRWFSSLGPCGSKQTKTSGNPSLVVWIDLGVRIPGFCRG